MTATADAEETTPIAESVTPAGTSGSYDPLKVDAATAVAHAADLALQLDAANRTLTQVRGAHNELLRMAADNTGSGREGRITEDDIAKVLGAVIND